VPSRTETPKTAPGAPSTWETRGVVTVGTVAEAVDELILTAVFQNLSKVYRKKVADFRAQVAGWVIAKGAEKLLARELLKEALKRVQAAVNIFRERKFQETLRAAIRAAYLKKAEELWAAKLAQGNNSGNRKKQRVKTRVPDTGRKPLVRGRQLEVGKMSAPRKSNDGAEDLGEGLEFFFPRKSK